MILKQTWKSYLDFIDVNEATNEYYINENKKTRALSYVSDSDWQALQNVSPVNLEKCKKDLQALNEQVAEAVSDPKVAYMVFSCKWENNC